MVNKHLILKTSSETNGWILREYTHQTAITQQSWQDLGMVVCWQLVEKTALRGFSQGDVKINHWSSVQQSVLTFTPVHILQITTVSVGREEIEAKIQKECKCGQWKAIHYSMWVAINNLLTRQGRENNSTRCVVRGCRTSGSFRKWEQLQCGTDLLIIKQGI